MNARKYLIIGFAYREGNVYRQDKSNIDVHSAESSATVVLEVIRQFAAKGHQVLVFEDGFIKPDWCRLHVRAYRALLDLDLQTFRRFFAGVPIDQMDLTVDGFMRHVYERFPQYSGQHSLKV